MGEVIRQRWCGKASAYTRTGGYVYKIPWALIFGVGVEALRTRYSLYYLLCTRTLLLEFVLFGLMIGCSQRLYTEALT